VIPGRFDGDDAIFDGSEGTVHPLPSFGFLIYNIFPSHISFSLSSLSLSSLSHFTNILTITNLTFQYPNPHALNYQYINYEVRPYYYLEIHAQKKRLM
jgi:hypothetical protein